MVAQAVKDLVRECLLVLQLAARTHPIDLTTIITTFVTISVLRVVEDLIVMVLTNTDNILLMMSIFIMNQEEEVMAGATILMMSIIVIHLQVDVMAGEYKLIIKMVIHTIMKHSLEYRFKCNSSVLWLQPNC
eukprot:7226556-Ditylum_brightwellii.AAC.1